MAGGPNVYGFVVGDPVNYHDPFGDIVEIRGSMEFRRYVLNLRDTDPEFRADYNLFDADRENVFLILQDPLTQSGKAIGGRSGGYPSQDFSEDIAILARRFRIPNLKAVLRIGSAEGHDPWWCQLRHEAIHLRPLVGNGWNQAAEDAHDEFVELNKAGCNGNEHRPKRVRR